MYHWASFSQFGTSFLAILLSFPLNGQGHKNLKFRNITRVDGLSSSNVTGIVQDHKGFTWIGTTEGLNRYDGYQVQTFGHDATDSTSLAGNNITALFVDHVGVLWIGTENGGLSRYNEYTESFHNYRFDIYDPLTINFNYISSITEDKKKDLWIGTLMGLNKYNRDTDTFERYLYRRVLKVGQQTLEAMDSLGFSQKAIEATRKLVDTSYVDELWFKDYLSAWLERKPGHIFEQVVQRTKLGNFGEAIRVMYPDDHGNLWLGFEHSGVGYYQPGCGLIKKVNASSHRLSSNEITTLFPDDSTLWIGTRSGGLYRLDLASEKLEQYPIPWASSFIKCILKDRSDRLWIGNDEGLGLYNPRNKTFSRYSVGTNSNSTLPSNTITTLYEDDQGGLWIGSFQGGVSFYLDPKPFRHYKNFPGIPSSLSANSVSSILVDNKEHLWIGYYTSGVDHWVDGDKRHFPAAPGTPGGLGEGTVFSIHQDREGTIWLGTYRGGLQKYRAQEDVFISYRNDPNDPYSISGNDVRSIDEDSEGNLWLAIHGGGVNKFNKKTGRCERYNTVYPDLQHTLVSDWVNSILVDSQERVWAATVSGLSLLLPGAKDFVSFTREKNGLSHNNVKTLFEDDHNRLWIGTDDGLNLFIDSLQTFLVFRKQHGLPSNTIKSIEQDEDGLLWISTNHGLSRFDYEAKVFKNYSEEDGLQSDEYFIGASNRDKQGKLYFGGKNGLNIFRPSLMQTNTFKPPIYLSGLKLFNQKVSPGDPPGILHTPLVHAKELHFKHDQNFFSLSFTALDYTNPGKSQYSYKLEGFNNDWNHTGTQKEATFTNVPPGRYVFKVKAANNDGLWSEDFNALALYVHPPLWQTVWAYIFYVILLLAVVLGVRKMVLHRIYLKHKIQLDEMKIKFFENISHEFRTPLTLIVEPLNQLISSEKDEDQKDFTLLPLIQRNAKRLLRLANQLMELYKLDAGFAKLMISEEPLETLVKNVFYSFTHGAKQKQLHYRLYSTLPLDQAGHVDRDKFENILYNLISNAIKFTPERGAVMVFASISSPNKDGSLKKKIKTPNSKEAKYLKISVVDSGFGISRDIQNKIFKRFYQASHHEGLEPGTGIGLSLVSQLTEIHKGVIQVESELDNGSRFTFWIPVEKQAYHEDELATGLANQQYVAHQEDYEENFADPLEPSPKETSKPILLIIDDNEDIREYLRHNLASNFNIQEASNGPGGISLAENSIPDIVLTDIMMPGMNGIQVCKTLKNDQRTSHIPVILLTAKTDEVSHLEGLGMGADDYITKPFNIDILKAKLKNIIKHQQVLRRKNMEILPQSKNFTGSRPDQLFLNNVFEIIEKNLSNPSFGPDVLAKEVGMSRSVLYRKVTGLTGRSVSILVRTYRLNRAAQMLSDEHLPIKELAFKVGFNDPAYFTTCFKKLFNVSPKDYSIQMKEGI